MKKLYHILSLSIIVCLTVIAVAACSGKKEAGGKAASEQKTINYWSFFNEGEPLQIWLQGIIDDYQKETGAKVNVVWAGRDILTKISARLASPVSEDFPDVIEYNSGGLMNLATEQGVLVPLDEYFAQPNSYTNAARWSDMYIPSVLSVGTAADGTIYLVPRESYIHAFHYNKKMFVSLGISVPQTWEELMAAAAKIKAAGIAPFSIDSDSQDRLGWWYVRVSEHTVGTKTLQEACEGKIKFSSDPGFLTAAECLQEIIDKGYFQNNYQGSIWPASQLLWVQSKVAMIPSGTWLPAEMSDSTPSDFEMDVFALPAIKSEKYPRSEEAWGNYWAILKDAPHKDAAIDFIKFTSQKKYDDAMTKIGTPSSQVNGLPVQKLASQGSILQAAATVSNRYADILNLGDYTTRVFCPTVTELLFGQLDAKGFIAKMDAETARYYNQ
jgi:raffinose/stachyose/melibiose transport system substrate-binding protein